VGFLCGMDIKRGPSTRDEDNKKRDVLVNKKSRQVVGRKKSAAAKTDSEQSVRAGNGHRKKGGVTTGWEGE